jgi:putative ABC transport system permease protein
MRTVLSTLGVIIGVGSLVAILSVSDGLEQYSREQIERTTDLQTILVTPKTVETLEGISVRRANPFVFSPGDAETLSVILDGRAVSALIVTASDRIRLEADTSLLPALVIGTVPGAREVFSLVLDEGRFLDPSDLNNGEAVAVLSRNAASRLNHGLSLPSLLGKTVQAKGSSFLIVGIVSGMDDEGLTKVYVPLSEPSFAASSSAEGKTAVAVIRVNRVEDIEPVRRRVEEWLTEKTGSVEEHFFVSSSRQRVAQIQQAMMVFKLTMGSIAGISLIVGGIGIMNILLASVSERTREIGIRRAAGARARDILLQLLAESVAISGLGSLLGVLLGLAGSVVITALIRSLTEAPLQSAFTWNSILVAAGAACFIGFTFGIYPARKASKLSPTDAIRYE